MAIERRPSTGEHQRGCLATSNTVTKTRGAVKCNMNISAQRPPTDNAQPSHHRPESHLPMTPTLPMSPTLLALNVDHEDTLTGPVTVIVRTFDRPDLCHNCPGRKCVHDPTFCVVRATENVPEELCGTYVLPQPPVGALEGPSRLRV